MYMPQLNMHISPDFDRELASWMEARGIATKSEAIRVAVRESLARLRSTGRPHDYRELVGLVKPTAPASKRKFKSDDDLWK
jgi:hypothetical protein